MSLSKPNTLDPYAFAIALPFSNLPINYSRWLTCANIIIYRIVLCALPCILYMVYFKKLMNKHMLRYVQTGAFCCFSYIALLTYVCYRSDYIHKHFPPHVLDIRYSYASFFYNGHLINHIYEF